jgi:hypothetical protein
VEKEKYKCGEKLKFIFSFMGIIHEPLHSNELRLFQTRKKIMGTFTVFFWINASFDEAFNYGGSVKC